ncbi:NADP-dependent oxidoreductase [Streptomyces sp. NPDC051985]|uniref:quinone oxidoreductase family protein n=1 Tax=Streptomyces sp. NPDC051985 TaxID=3155807 RepID=UPI00343053F5
MSRRGAFDGTSQEWAAQGMRAVGVFDFGGPEVLRVAELPDPRPGPGEVLVRVRAATVNASDTLIRCGARAAGEGEEGPPPYVPGMEAAGLVEAVGEGVAAEPAVGERVMAFVVPVGSRGAYAERIVVPAESVARVPSHVSDAEAATVPMNGATARVALDTLGLRAGQVVAVSGAAGTVGGYVIQMAKADGLRVVADSSEADERLVRGFGAEVIVPRGDDFGHRVRAEFPAGADGAVDCALLGAAMAPAVRDGGAVITLRLYSEPAERGVRFVPIRAKHHATDRALLERLRRYAEDGTITLRVAGTFPMEKAVEAHRRLEAGGVRGRLVLEF